MAKAQTPKAETQTAPQQEPQTLPMRYDVRIHTLRPEGTCKATASVNLNGCFAIRGVKVMDSSKGLFVSLPSYRAGNGEYRDICFPCTKEARAEFDAAVIGAYQQALTQGMAQGQMRQSPPDPTAQQAQVPEMGM